MFDFSKYFKRMSGKTDAKIELKDVPIKADSSASTDDGDMSLNEFVTRNIDYIVTGITLGDYSHYYDTDKYFEGSDNDKNEGKLVQNCSVIDEDNNESEDRYAFRLGSSLGDAEYEVPRPNGTLISTVKGYAHYDDDSNIDQKVALTLNVVPKYTLIKNPQPVVADKQDAIVYAHAMAMFGLFGSGCETYKWATSDKYEKKNCVLSYRTLERRMNKVASEVRENKFEVEVSTYYDLVDPDAPVPADGSSQPDVTVLTPPLPGSMTYESMVNADTAGFCKRMQNYGYMIDCTGDNQTPFLPSLRDAFEAYFPKEDVAEDFNDAFDDVLSGVKSLWVLKKSLKKSTRKKIEDISSADFRNATNDEYNYVDPNETFLVDIESMKCTVNETGDWNASLTIVSPYYTADSYHRYMFVGPTNEYYTYTRMSRPKNDDEFNDAYGDNNIDKAMISYTEYGLPDFYELVKDYFNDYMLDRMGITTDIENQTKIWTLAFVNHALAATLTPVNNNRQATFYFKPLITSENDINNYSDVKIRVVDWYREAVLTDDGKPETNASKNNPSLLVPLFQPDTSFSSANLAKKLSIVDDVDDIVDKFDAAIIAMAFLHPKLAAVLKTRLRSLERSVTEVNRVVNRIKYFEYYTADSVFESKDRILKDGECFGVDSNGIPLTAKYPARMLIPTRIYRKVKKRKRVLWFYRTVTKTQCIGIRWTEIRFINVGLYSKYPKDMSIPQRMIPFESEYTRPNDIIVTNEIPTDLEAGKKVSLKITNVDEEVSATIVDAHTISVDSSVQIPSTGTTQYFMVGLDDTKSGDETTQVNIEYNLPYFPYDEEIRGYAFGTYGPFDQSRYAIKDRSGSLGSGKDGWRIFFDTSKEISSLRKGINIYPSVAYLLRILRDNFGKDRVELLETTRSVDDQRSRCLGGSESAFLSWHNYGLAVKIMIYADDNKTPIKDGSDDMMKLVDIARDFTNDCLAGKYGAMFNVVWCGRLTVGANLFDWEFLPIGVNHKDAPKFRDSLIAQRDPIVDFSYVPATKYAKAPTKELQKDKTTQWIPNNSSVYLNAERINNVPYVSPTSIRNFKFPKNLPLINLIEFLRMIQLKMDAYGTKMPDKGDMYEWLNKNGVAYQQLLVYFGMTGNLQSFRALLAGEYITRYKPIVSSYYSTDPIAFVKNFLGDEYYKVQIKAEDMIDASYITLADGKLHIPCGDGRPYLPQSIDNMYDQKQVTKDNYQRGRWINGLFVPATVEDEYVSTSSVIGGYNEGVAVGGDAYILHAFIGDQIKQEFDAIVKMFEEYKGELMFDSFYNGPYADKFEQLENEFGVIAKQDLIDFDHLKGMLTVADLNEQSNGTAITTTTAEDGTEYSDIYEKVVSNAEVAGMRLASLSSEHLEVNPPKAETVTIEDVYKIISNGSAPTANDIVNFRRSKD